MRILQIHNEYRYAGGEDTVAENEAELLRGAGHDVVVHRERNAAGPAASARDLALAPWNPIAARRIARMVAEVGPDVVHVHNTWFRLSPSIFAAIQGAGVPVALTAHNFRLVCANAQLLRDGQLCELCVDSHPWHGVRHACYRDSRVASVAAAATISLSRRRHSLERDVDVIAALTVSAQRRLVRSGVPADRIVVKPNFVADPGPRSAAAAGSNAVLYVGRLSPEKGIEFLLRTWEKGAPSGLELMVVGDGPLRTQLESRAIPGVRIIGPLPRDEVLALMLSSRMLIYPSTWPEGLPMVLLEALAAGLPILATRHLDAVDSTVAPLGPQWLFSRGEEAELLEALHRVREDAEVERASASARDVYERSFTPEVGLGLLDSLYAAAIARHAV